jgi:hypothetical protein
MNNREESPPPGLPVLALVLSKNDGIRRPDFKIGTRIMPSRCYCAAKTGETIARLLPCFHPRNSEPAAEFSKSVTLSEAS